MGSGIIFNNGGGGGGTTINPTNLRIPVRSNATTFIDSVLENGNNYLYSNYGGYTGLGLDFANFVSYLGDWNNLINGTTLVVNDQTNNIYTKWNGVVNGLNLDFAGNNYLFGDYAGGMGLEWDNGNNEFVLKQQGLEYIVVGNSTAYFGQRVNFSYKIDYNTSILSIGDNGGVLAGSLFVLDLNQDIICTQTQGNRKGLLLDFANTEYKFGDFNGVNKGNYIYIEDANNTIHFYALNLDFNGGNLQSNTSGGNSGEHLVITLNGNPYKIKLEFP